MHNFLYPEYFTLVRVLVLVGKCLEVSKIHPDSPEGSESIKKSISVPWLALSVVSRIESRGVDARQGTA